ncbi:SET domain-containing 5-like protein [Cladobotryum mycophilum]|uniref:SET domain-containing 5-like protein n=1 Tax=Cladobotryum mycophilum TaxID=491253 RepID=A0ABR0S7Z2_9HYPO
MKIHHALHVCSLSSFFQLQQKAPTCPVRQLQQDVQDAHNKSPFTFKTQMCANKYCVYTDERFWGGRGISFVTTADAIKTPVTQGLERHYRKEVVARVAIDPFEQREIVGKGIGLVAKRFLEKGELIIWEPPSLMVHLDMRDDVPEEQRLAMQRAAVDALPLKAKSETLGLMGHWGGDPIEDRLDTNSFTVTLEKRMDHHALFTQTSRLNHACRPNCYYLFDRETLTHSVYTIRDVQPGEELSISYIDPVATYAERQEEIRNWGFNCSCFACMLPVEAREISDDRIRLIHHYTKELEDWSSESCGTPDMAETLIDMYQDEGLFSNIADGYKLAAHSYSAVRDKYNALRTANNAMGYGLQTWKFMGIRMRDVLELMMDPEAHWSWNHRPRTDKDTGLMKEQD